MDLKGATPALIGLAIGAYGLTQAVLQIPFGMISDRIGRFPVIYAGLLIFALGAVVSAMSDSIWGVIAGRILQGAGAISAVVMALLSDLTREQHRTKAMAMIGMSIGLSFAAAMVIGPLITKTFGLSGLFWFTALMAVLGGVIIATLPKPSRLLRHRESGVAKQALWSTLRHKELLRLDLSISVLHAVLMASFVVLPLVLLGMLLIGWPRRALEGLLGRDGSRFYRHGAVHHLRRNQAQNAPDFVGCGRCFDSR